MPLYNSLKIMYSKNYYLGPYLRKGKLRLGFLSYKEKYLIFYIMSTSLFSLLLKESKPNRIR